MEPKKDFRDKPPTPTQLLKLKHLGVNLTADATRSEVNIAIQKARAEKKGRQLQQKMEEEVRERGLEANQQIRYNGEVWTILQIGGSDERSWANRLDGKIVRIQRTPRGKLAETIWVRPTSIKPLDPAPE